MTRARLAACLAALLMVAGISTWLLAAEAHGLLPAGHFEARSHPVWPVTAERADAIRRDALARASVRSPVATPPRGNVEPVVCRYLAEPPRGTSAKFNCVLEGGDVIKVKYGRNPEIQAEAAAARLLLLLGYAADEVHIVPRVRCYGCPRFPFVATQLLSLAGAPTLLGPNGHGNGYSDFEWPAVERRFDAPAIEAGDTEGWAWFELKASQAPRADLDALRLLAVFLAHWDNKSENQRLVCLETLPQHPDQPCPTPLLMMQDLGSTFGPTKVNVAVWRGAPIWLERGSCTVSMRSFPYHGATFSDLRISEAGRSQLAAGLSSITRDQVVDMFSDARFPEFQSGTDDARDLEAWVAAFEYRRDQIVAAGPCP